MTKAKSRPQAAFFARGRLGRGGSKPPPYGFVRILCKPVGVGALQSLFSRALEKHTLRML